VSLLISKPIFSAEAMLIRSPSSSHVAPAWRLGGKPRSHPPSGPSFSPPPPSPGIPSQTVACSSGATAWRRSGPACCGNAMGGEAVVRAWTIGVVGGFGQRGSWAMRAAVGHLCSGGWRRRHGGWWLGLSSAEGGGKVLAAGWATSRPVACCAVVGCSLQAGSGQGGPGSTGGGATCLACNPGHG
jgi:hypothetical protein